MCYESLFMEIKMLLQSNKFNRNWRRKFCSRKFVYHKSKCKGSKKPFFLLKNIYLYNLWYLTPVKTLNNLGLKCFILNESQRYPKQVAFLCSTCLKLLLARSSRESLLASYDLFRVVRSKTSPNVLTCKFTMNQRGRVIDFGD